MSSLFRFGLLVLLIAHNQVHGGEKIGIRARNNTASIEQLMNITGRHLLRERRRHTVSRMPLK